MMRMKSRKSSPVHVHCYATSMNGESVGRPSRVGRSVNMRMNREASGRCRWSNWQQPPPRQRKEEIEEKEIVSFYRLLFFFCPSSSPNKLSWLVGVHEKPWEHRLLPPTNHPPMMEIMVERWFSQTTHTVMYLASKYRGRSSESVPSYSKIIGRRRSVAGCHSSRSIFRGTKGDMQTGGNFSSRWLSLLPSLSQHRIDLCQFSWGKSPPDAVEESNGDLRLLYTPLPLPGHI